MSLPELALVIPVYNESEVLPELLRRLAGLFEAEAEQADWTAILVDDGAVGPGCAACGELAEEVPRDGEELRGAVEDMRSEA